jgi:cytochrome c oxidase assembly factor CtaG
MKWIWLALLALVGYQIVLQIACIRREKTKHEVLHLVFLAFVFLLLILMVWEFFGASRDSVLNNLMMWLVLVSFLGPGIVTRLAAGKGPWFPVLLEPVHAPWKSKPDQHSAAPDDASAGTGAPTHPSGT